MVGLSGITIKQYTVVLRITGGALAGGMLTSCICLSSYMHNLSTLSVKSIAGLAGGITAGLMAYDLRECVLAGFLASVMSTVITATVLALPSILGIIKEPNLANAFAGIAIQKAFYDFILTFIMSLVGSIGYGLIKES